MLRVLSVALVLFVVHHGGSGITPTSADNCYYTFVVPRDQDGGVSGGLSIDAEVNQLRREVTDLRASFANLLVRVTELETDSEKKQDNSDGGVNFVNWGRTACPLNTTSIYHGYVAKAIFNSNGGGVDYLCLPEDPEWTGNEARGLQQNSYIHGVEYYATGVPKIFPEANRNQNMPCAVCEVSRHSQSLMIPAKITCPAGWSTVYQGYLMAERTHPAHLSPSNYICANKEFEFSDGGASSEHSGYALPVEVVCGIIPCPPYTEGNELPCVVCVK